MNRENFFTVKGITSRAENVFLNILQGQGLPASRQRVKQQVAEIKEAVRNYTAFETVMDKALNIVEPQTVVQRCNFWFSVLELFLMCPVKEFGCSMVENMIRTNIILFPTWYPDGPLYPIAQDDFLYTLDANTQIHLFLYVTYEVPLSESMDKKREAALLDNTDALMIVASVKMGDGNYRKAYELESEIRRRLKEPDEALEDSWNTLRSKLGIRNEAEAGNNLFGRKTQVKREAPKISRNALCPCGSGLKYKNCCGKNA